MDKDKPAATQGLIYAAINAVMGEVGAISKDRKNLQQGYAFRGIDDLYLALQSTLVKNKLFFVPTLLNTQREERQTKAGGSLTYTTLTIKYTFYAADGSSIESVVIGEAMDSGDKSSNKAMSSALKYALLQIFCIPTEEDKDVETHSPEPLPKPKAILVKPASVAPIVKPVDPAAPKPVAGKASEAQVKMLFAKMHGDLGYNSEQGKDFIIAVTTKTSSSLLTSSDVQAVVKAIEEEKKAIDFPAAGDFNS